MTGRAQVLRDGQAAGAVCVGDAGARYHMVGVIFEKLVKERVGNEWISF